MAGFVKPVGHLGKLAIRLQLHGCTNRPFYHIVVMRKGFERDDPIIEQLGSFDPLPNSRNEKLIALNLERIRYWLGYGCDMSVPVAQLLGLSGFLPIHPETYRTIWTARKRQKEAEQKKEDEKLNQNAEMSQDDATK